MSGEPHNQSYQENKGGIDLPPPPPGHLRKWDPLSPKGVSIRVREIGAHPRVIIAEFTDRRPGKIRVQLIIQKVNDVNRKSMSGVVGHGSFSVTHH
jgi:hypothetical protein